MLVESEAFPFEQFFQLQPTVVSWAAVGRGILGPTGHPLGLQKTKSTSVFSLISPFPPRTLA